MMGSIFSNDRVRLVRDLPELSLRTGTIGVVRSTWLYPTTAFEVEFQPSAHRDGIGHRLLLLEGEVVPLTEHTAGSPDRWIALAG